VRRPAVLTEQGDFSISTLVHPILIGLYPALALFAENKAEIPIHDSFRSLLVLSTLALALLLITSLTLSSWQKGAVLTSVTLLLFFSYGHVYTELKNVRIGAFLIGRHRFLIPSFLILEAATILAMKRGTANLFLTNRVFAVSAGALTIIPLASIVFYEAQILVYSARPAGRGDNSQYVITAQSGADLPDVYYIIPDAYARWDVLAEGYGYDNSEFLTFLNEHGFYVATESNANYLWTHLSMGSSLNMNYFQDLVPEGAPDYKLLTGNLLHHSLVRSILEEAGYKTVGFATGWSGSEMLDADYVLTPNMTGFEAIKARGILNPYEGMLIEDSLLKIFLDIDSLHGTPLAIYARERLQIPYTVQRDVILGLFDNMKKVTEIDGPKFVFVHILAPHGPFIFGRNGEVIASSGAFTLADNPDIPTEIGNEKYVDELIYITHRIEETIDYIQKHSKRPVVIIIQSDHGASPTLEWDNPTIHAVREKMGILNAYYFPDSCRSLLYPTISPVNSFRLLFNCEFGMSLPLLDDVTYVGYNDFTLSEEYFATLQQSQP